MSAGKRPTAAEKRERKEQEAERYGRTFLRDMANATTFQELWKLANGSRPSNTLSDRYHHWLGCALHGNPYDSAPPEVIAAIEAALKRIGPRP